MRLRDFHFNVTLKYIQTLTKKENKICYLCIFKVKMTFTIDVDTSPGINLHTLQQKGFSNINA